MKKYIKQFVPPIILYLYNRLPIHNFKKFWINNRQKIDFDNELKIMIDHFIKSKSLRFLSNYWHYLSIKNINQLIKDGSNIKKYSTSVATSYYTFLDFNEEQISRAAKLVESDFFELNINLFKKHKNFSHTQSIKYNNLTYLLYLNLKKTNYFERLSKLGDEGYVSYNDPYMEIDKIKVTSDKLNSLFDYDKINRFSNLDNVRSVLEIGAGSGRTSQAIMSFNKNLKYIICDVPLALYISYKRLSSVFKEKKIKTLYNIDDENELNLEIDNNDISFIMPHQLRLIKSKKIDLSIAIDCIHEMDKKTITTYMEYINNISNMFYFSVWKETYVPFSGIFRSYSNKLDYFSDDYNIPKNWKKDFEEDLIFPSNFIAAGYSIKD